MTPAQRIRVAKRILMVNSARYGLNGYAYTADQPVRNKPLLPTIRKRCLATVERLPLRPSPPRQLMAAGKGTKSKCFRSLMRKASEMPSPPTCQMLSGNSSEAFCISTSLNFQTPHDLTCCFSG